jgi:hypothetical protein
MWRSELASSGARPGSPLVPEPGSSVAVLAGLRPVRPENPGQRAARWLGSWPFLVVTAVLVVAATVVAALGDAPPVAVLGLVIGGLVLLELPLLFMAVRSADRISSGLATDHLDSDRQLAGEVDELADTVARLAVELARLNARLRAGSPAVRKDAEL